MKMHVPRHADDRYARQRQAGLPALRFEPALEQEYRASYVQLNASQLRIAHLLSALSALGFIIIDHFAIGLTPPLALKIVLFVTLPALILPVALTFLPEPGVVVQRCIFYCGWVVGISVVMTVEISRSVHPAFPYEALLLVVMYTYLVSGLLFQQAAVVGWSVAAAFVLIETAFMPPRPDLPYQVFYLFIANVIGMIGVYIFQYQSRRSFLLHAELWLRAVQDPLTGVFNRREFLSRLETAWALAQRQNVALGLLMVDVDEFKSINDNRGHAVGDQVLMAVATVLRESTQRPLDAVGRYGGDELVAVWYDVDRGWLETQARRLPERWRAWSLEGNAIGVNISASGGLVLVRPQPGLQPRDAIARADAILYERKRQARGTIGLSQVDSRGVPA